MSKRAEPAEPGAAPPPECLAPGGCPDCPLKPLPPLDDVGIVPPGLYGVHLPDEAEFDYLIEQLMPLINAEALAREAADARAQAGSSPPVDVAAFIRKQNQG